MEEKIKSLKENMNTFEEWGNPKYKGFLEHVLKHYPDVSDKQLKTIEINFYQLQRYLNKGSKRVSNNKFSFDFDENEIDYNINLLYDYYFDFESNDYDDPDDLEMDEREKINEEIHETYDSNDNIKINDKKLKYFEINIDIDELDEDTQEQLDIEITKILSAYEYNYYNGYMVGVISLVEDNNKNKYISIRLDDIIEGEGNSYMGHANNLIKKDFDKNIKSLISKYLSERINRY